MKMEKKLKICEKVSIQRKAFEKRINERQIIDVISIVGGGDIGSK
jgi:hypothetical protein